MSVRRIQGVREPKACPSIYGRNISDKPANVLTRHTEYRCRNRPQRSKSDIYGSDSDNCFVVINLNSSLSIGNLGPYVVVGFGVVIALGILIYSRNYVCGKKKDMLVVQGDLTDDRTLGLSPSQTLPLQSPSMAGSRFRTAGASPSTTSSRYRIAGQSKSTTSGRYQIAGQFSSRTSNQYGMPGQSPSQTRYQ